MAELTFKFGTPAPVTFREHGCDKDFTARVTGSAAVSAYALARYGEGEAAEAALRKAASELVSDCLARWPEGKLVMGPGNREILNGLLETALSAAGVTAKVEVRSIDLIEGQMDAYMQACGEALRECMCPSVRTDGLTDEPHGPLIGLSYNLSSHGMMMGSSSSSGDSLNWNRDGSIILTSSYSGGGSSSQTEYRVKPEVAERVRDYVAREHLAALSKEKIPTPQACDNFTSSSIAMTFDDRALGGSPFEMLHIQCGPAGMTFRKIEDEISELLKACRESGECIQFKNTESDGTPGGMLNLMNMPMAADPSTTQLSGSWACPKCGHLGNAGAFCAVCAAPRPTFESVKPATATQAGPLSDGWTCANCGHTGNGGRFCVNCGSPR
ncbi:MAG: hypothetical protein E7425_04550 [Ruminococcaceae bacterium]|nr:hypothetical protein [Oscillospiraceae bacterium]